MDLPVWLESVYSDGTSEFVSEPHPTLGSTVTVRLRMYEDAPVRYVFLRTVRNGAEQLIEGKRAYVNNGFAYYEARLRITEKRMHYHFYLVCDDVIYYYNQKEITTYIPDHTWDFALLTDYRQPSWVKGAVFYQIFPDRFFNGDPGNDVKDGETEYQGHISKHYKSWDESPLQYEGGWNLDFYGGDLEGVITKLPYLRKLGITAIYLNPIFTAPSNHKYDCVDYEEVDPHLGGNEALERLSKSLHENGMRLVLDISINHTGSDHRWFNKDGTFYPKSTGAFNNIASPERTFYFFGDDGKSYQGWFDVPTLPVLNYTSAQLRERLYRGKDAVLRKWLRPPYSIDGWRFDVADVMAKRDELQLSHEVWQEIRKSIREENPDAYILAEDWGDCGEYLQGDEWDSAMNYFGCGRVLRQFLGLPDLFHDRNEHLRKIRHRMTAEDVRARIIQHLAKLPFAMWENQFNLIDSHDVPRAHNFDEVTFADYRGAVILQFMLIGAPSIYYGDEKNIGGGTRTNEDCRWPMPWNTSGGRMFELYRTLAHLKTDRAAVREGGMKFLYAEGRILALARFCGEDVLIAVVSLEDEDREIRLPTGAAGITGQDELADLFGEEIRYIPEDVHAVRLTVKAHSAYILERVKGGLAE